MTALVLDAGAFIAVEKGDRATAARLRVAYSNDVNLRTTGVVVAQIWRDPKGRQAGIARLLKAVEVKAVDEHIGREAGVLLGRCGSGDAIDATVVAVSETGDVILTSDAGDIEPLVASSSRAVRIIGC
ncbi:MAG: twitching motility protein PilT [Actinomycetota bacterium]|jgi:predicted nucleic acid-binding protein|nr:twitching motility protein PilT [Actinomycetota bacterium]